MTASSVFTVLIAMLVTFWLPTGSIHPAWAISYILTSIAFHLVAHTVSVNYAMNRPLLSEFLGIERSVLEEFAWKLRQARAAAHIETRDDRLLETQQTYEERLAVRDDDHRTAQAIRLATEEYNSRHPEITN